MEPKNILKEINKLKLSEKIILVEDVWDSIAKNNLNIPLPQWQKQELEKRYKEFKNGNNNLHNWDEIHEGLRKKNK